MEIHEVSVNRIIDVVVGMIGFFIAWRIVESVGASSLFLFSFLSLLALAALNILGWRAYRRRGKGKS